LSKQRDDEVVPLTFAADARYSHTFAHIAEQRNFRYLRETS